MKEKTGQLFWGFFLVTMGVLFLVVKYDIVNTSFSYVWDLWPVVLVFWGVFVLTKNSEFKPIIAILFGIFMGLMVYGTAFHVVEDEFNYDSDYDYRVNNYQADYDSTVKYAQLDVNTGGGKFGLSRVTNNLVKATAKGEHADYDFFTSEFDSSATITINYQKDSFNILDGNIRNNLDIKLNPEPIWDLNFKLGASKSRFDISDFKVRSIDLKTGASDTRFKVGDLYPKTYIKVEMGAAAVKFLIPKDSGCRLRGDMVLFAKNLEGFTKYGDSQYRTENYEDATNIIELDIDGGMGSLTIVRY